jgi:hypothetical protein
MLSTLAAVTLPFQTADRPMEHEVAAVAALIASGGLAA